MQSNKVILIGQVGKDLDTRTMPNGDRRVALRVFTRYQTKDDAGKAHWHSQWHDIIAWKEPAMYAERNFVKGSRILIQGSIEYRTYLDKAAHKRYLTRIRAVNFENLDR